MLQGFWFEQLEGFSYHHLEEGRPWMRQEIEKKVEISVWGEFEIPLDIQVGILGKQLLMWVWSSNVLNIKCPAQCSEQSECSVSGSSLPSPYL